VPRSAEVSKGFGSGGCPVRTVSSVDLGLGAGGLADEDGDVGVASLHGRVGPGDE
jgi:hypothetical protein